MWLINTTTICLEPVFNPEDGKYAILSHTWGLGEVSFQEFADPEKRKQKAGYAKIHKTCELAKDRGLKYAWVDTCCIDKTSSAELSEAINSMFNWYRYACVCFAFIDDLPPNDTPKKHDDRWLSAKKTHRWFTRGWTLQELIAPTVVEFFDQAWIFRGSKISLVDELSSVTRINASSLLNKTPLSDISVAQRMSWASRRETTRVEDIAYCLLGIFGVNMPMLYGEGKRAFIRLQEEIAKESNDLSIFAWTACGSGTAGDGFNFGGILANSPHEFERCGTLEVFRNPMELEQSRFSMTNNGVKMKAKMGTSQDNELILSLSSDIQTWGGSRFVGIYLGRTLYGKFVRLYPDRLYITRDLNHFSDQRQTVFIHKLLLPVAKAQVLAQQMSRVYIDFQLDQKLVQDRYAIPLESTSMSPSFLWVPESRQARNGYFMALESQGLGTAERTLPFICVTQFDLQFQKTRICTCVLVAGFFNNSQGQSAPVAILYSDTHSDAHTKTILQAANDCVEEKGIDDKLIAIIYGLILFQHSPKKDSRLSWCESKTESPKWV
ncbi:beta transducin [Podospora fimiseda]|uniref:Beta transducin n=1 Tax=Podospora fimiseda TaxID=252190 RepID=A0AAN7H2N2_9PEZI|nr:beta transducin [Podospora fimiseda]